MINLDSNVNYEHLEGFGYGWVKWSHLPDWNKSFQIVVKSDKFKIDVFKKDAYGRDYYLRPRIKRSGKRSRTSSALEVIKMGRNNISKSSILDEDNNSKFKKEARKVNASGRKTRSNKPDKIVKHELLGKKKRK